MLCFLELNDDDDKVAVLPLMCTLLGVLDASCKVCSVCQVECKRAEPKDAVSSHVTSDAAAAGGAMILAQAADGSVGLVPASALQVSPSLLQCNAAVGPAAAAGGVGLLSSTDLSAAAATYRPQDLMQPSLLPAGQSPVPILFYCLSCQ